MPTDRVLLFTDVVDSTRLTEQLGDEAASRLWAEHDGVARRLMAEWRGREIDKADGFLLLFDNAGDAVAFALELHQSLAALQPPLSSRAGIHVGPMVTRPNNAGDIALGAKPLELDGIGKALAARVMMLARGGQTLLSAGAHAALAGRGPWRTQSHGHWRLKGLADPIELFEVGHDGAPFVPPPDSAKAYRVIPSDDGWKPRAQLRHGLPAERDTFVGRLDALRALAARFDDDTRLVSLLGIGGIGKTRLALRYARDWLGNWPGGAWFCDLSSAHSLDGIVHAVAQGLDVPLGKADPVQQLGAAIAGRGECLVILDNFEQVARHAEATVGAWLERAPEARFLITTREVLGIVGEQAIALAPMSIDEGSALFEQRARAVESAFAPSAADMAALPRLIDLLDRLPLAIELAAARVRVMSVSSILGRMGERFKLLVTRGGRRDRQATLRAALDWSWGLLSPVEQSALTQLSVFEGGFTLEAAEAVVDTAPDVQLVVLDILQSLADKSLVQRLTLTRFNLLRSVQEYAAQSKGNTPQSAHLAEVTISSAIDRHCTYYASMSEVEATAEKCIETENLVLACRRAMDRGAMSSAAAALTTTWSAMRLTGPLAAVIKLADRLNSCARGNPIAAATALWVGGNARELLGNAVEARTMLEQALVRADGDQLLTGRIACTLGTMESSSGNVDRAQALLESALQAASNASDPGLQCRALNGLGALADLQSRLDLSRHRYEAALALARKAGDARWEGAVLGNLGQLHHSLGLYEAARGFYESALVLVLASGDLRFEGNTRSNLGLLHHEQGRAEEAMKELTASLEVATRIGHVQLQIVASCNLGLAHDTAGHSVEAVSYFQGALRAAQSAGQQRAEALALVYLGRTLVRANQRADGLRFLEAAQSAVDKVDDARTQVLLMCAHAEVDIGIDKIPSAKLLLSQAKSRLQASQIAIDVEIGNEFKQIERGINPY